MLGCYPKPIRQRGKHVYGSAAPLLSLLLLLECNFSNWGHEDDRKMCCRPTEERFGSQTKLANAFSCSSTATEVLLTNG